MSSPTQSSLSSRIFNSPWSLLFTYCMAISLALHLWAALLSSGFYHADEHFQILEFLNWKLGHSSAGSLPIEFSEKMRPWFEVSVFYAMSRLWQTLGVSDPFAWATSFRLLSAVLGWSSVVLLAQCSRHWFRQERHARIALLILCLIWYLPAFHARISSENWGGSIFLIGLCSILLKRVFQKSEYFWLWNFACGLLWGFAFESRYQVAFMILGALLWLRLRAKLSWRELIVLQGGIVSAILLCTWIDSWGYGQWTFAPWNYIDFNLIRNMVSSVDTDPWWDLFRRATTESWPLLGVMVLVSLPLAWIVDPFQVLTWTHLPLFLVHCLIGHKELRFLFPLMHAAPIFIVLAAHGILHKIENGSWLKIVYGFLIFWNLVGLITLSTIPAWMPIRCLDYIWHLSERPLVIHTQEKNPFEISGIAMNFYRPPGVTIESVSSYSEVEHRLSAQPASPNKAYWLFYDGFKLSGDAEPLSQYCQLQFSALPSFLINLNRIKLIEQLTRHVTNWSIYKCSN